MDWLTQKTYVFKLLEKFGMSYFKSCKTQAGVFPKKYCLSLKQSIPEVNVQGYHKNHGKPQWNLQEPLEALQGSSACCRETFLIKNITLSSFQKEWCPYGHQDASLRWQDDDWSRTGCFGNLDWITWLMCKEGIYNSFCVKMNMRFCLKSGFSETKSTCI